VASDVTRRVRPTRALPSRVRRILVIMVWCPSLRK
jgi:hypothetical protein